MPRGVCEGAYRPGLVLLTGVRSEGPGPAGSVEEGEADCGGTLADCLASVRQQARSGVAVSGPHL